MSLDEGLCRVLADWVRSQAEISAKSVQSRNEYYAGQEFLETASTAEGAARQMCDRLNDEIIRHPDATLIWRVPPEIKKHVGFSEKYHCYARLALI
jgi:hypothetical protein